MKRLPFARSIASHSDESKGLDSLFLLQENQIKFIKKVKLDEAKYKKKVSMESRDKSEIMESLKIEGV